MLLLRCYAKVTDWIFEISNHATSADYRFLPIYSYGFWVAMGFFAAATLTTIELRRREKLNLLSGHDEEITIGLPPNMGELMFYFLFAFVVMLKLGGLIAYRPELSAGTLKLGAYLLSLKGSYVAGFTGAIAVSVFYYFSARKTQLPKPETKNITIYPSDNIGDLVIIAMVLGVLGSILFNFFETDDSISRFRQDPLGFLTSGLSVYGGLICAGIGFAVYAKRKKFNLAHFFDSVAPGFMLANGLGRLGCQTAGDGDWGIVNVHPKPDWIPGWLWSSFYEHNIIDQGKFIPGCMEEHCRMLEQAVYPTPIYEFMMCTVVFLILWSIRKKLTYKPGMVFSIFMILLGVQRYAIEQWRDSSGRNPYHIFGIALRQSELISIIIFTIGMGVTIYLYNRYNRSQPVS